MYEPYGTRFYELHANSSCHASDRVSLAFPTQVATLFFSSYSLYRSSFVSRKSQTTYHEVSSTAVRTSARVTRIYPSTFLSSHGQFSKVQRALIIEETRLITRWIRVHQRAQTEEKRKQNEETKKEKTVTGPP